MTIRPIVSAFGMLTASLRSDRRRSSFDLPSALSVTFPDVDRLRADVTRSRRGRELTIEAEEHLFAREAHLVLEKERRELSTRARRENELPIADADDDRASDTTKRLTRGLALRMPFEEPHRETIRLRADRFEARG